MNGIPVLRNKEEALAAFDTNEVDFAGLKRWVRSPLRTYATVSWAIPSLIRRPANNLPTEGSY